MKIKTINKVINKKFKEFLASITDSVTKDAVAKNSIITGGSIASMLLKEKVNDYDIYFTNKETALLVANYFVKQFNVVNSEAIEVIDGAVYQRYLKDMESQGIPRDKVEFKGVTGLNLSEDRIKINVKGLVTEKGAINPENEEETIENIADIVTDTSKPKYRPVALSCNAITLSDDVQLVIRFYGTPEEVHTTYDFVHATNYWTSSDEKLHINQAALESLITKDLKYFGSKYPIASVIRSRKFINRGWTCNAGQYLKMCFQISELDLSDMDVLEDQLVGVDVAYFGMLINAIKERQKNDPEFNVGYEYIAEIINRIF
jgi:hypothetical protein